jgi:uncharacterized protein (TIGR02680 family)
MSDPRRFRPVRAGIVNLYEYGDQVFAFSGGRLLLRGHNTSGKTKALELLLPFCLDGDIAPHKLDPFARAAKQMKWNLVGCVEDDQRIGYVWVEFERIADDGGVQRITAGIGLKANRSLPEVRRWHFVARGRRIGKDLSLLRGREPLSRADLVAELGDDGEVLDHQAAYRERLNALVFGFAGMEQYQTMLRLMLELRRPHLSKTLDPDGVAGMLSAGLPTVDDTLMRRVAGGLEQLESLEQGLARLRTVRERARRFHEQTYRTYLRAVLRDRAADLRATVSNHDRAAAQARHRTEERETAVRDLAGLREQLAAARSAADRLEGEERALLTSPEWGSVAEVEQLRERAAAQARTADAREQAAEEARGAAITAEAELLTARAAADEARRRAHDVLDELGAEAQRAGLGTRHAALAAQLVDEGVSAQSWADLAQDLARGWRAVLERHGELVRDAERATSRLARARETETTAADRLREADDRRDVAGDALGAARESLDAGIDTWRSALAELDGAARATDRDALERALEQARARAHGGGAGADRLAALAAARADALAEERAALLAERETLRIEAAPLAARRERLEAEHDEPPLASPLRRASRDDRPGAPLWRLVDFQDGVAAELRTALEAGLEAMGILDAWVTPDGRALDARTEDVVLVAGDPAPSAQTLADVLRPVEGAGVDPPLIEGLLRRVALEAPGSPSGGPAAAIDSHGAFRLGPLAGAAGKDHVDYIGAIARAERRAREIAALAEREAYLAAQRDRLGVEAATLGGRLARLREELASFPSSDEVAAALRALGVAHALHARLAAEHEQVVAAARAAADEQVARAAARREHAAEHRLAPELDADALALRREACAGYVAGAPGAAREWSAAADAGDRVTDGFERLASLQAAAAERERAAKPERQEAERLAAEHAARETALGDTAAEVRARHARVTQELRAARAHRDDLDASERVADRAVHERASAESAAEQTRDTATQRREAAVAAFARPAAAGLLPLAVGDAAPPDHAEAARWPLTRALEVARSLPAELLTVRSSAGELAQEVLRRVALLDRELADADMGAHASQDADGLVLVQVSEGPGARGLAEVLDALDGEIAERERVLSAEERRVFNDALVEELAEHLRLRIHRVRSSVASMNAVLRGAPTAGGKVVQLEWRALDDETGDRRRTADLLTKRARWQDDANRSALVDFFRARIDEARRAEAEAGEPVPMSALLADAFDYRRWFGFGLLLEIDGHTERLTARRHAVGSGGEQAVLIHLPLFAAAAALYGDTPAPRLVMLDEALSGIDDETRERVLGATVAFDLDLVMTSHELWGTYRTVPQLAIYQLHREQGDFGVHAIRFLWDGDRLRELEQDQLDPA